MDEKAIEAIETRRDNFQEAMEQMESQIIWSLSEELNMEYLEVQSIWNNEHLLDD